MFFLDKAEQARIILLDMAHARKSSDISTAKGAVALLLTFAAGYVDIVGYAGLYHVFTANMTGNTVHLAENLMQARWNGVALTGAVLLFFLIGSVVGRTAIEVGARNRIRRIASVTFLIEAALLGFVLTFPQPDLGKREPAWLLVLLAAAMGLQTATLTRVGPLTVHTTFVTGMLNKFAQLISHGLFLAYDVLNGREQVRTARQVTFRRSLFIFSIWLLYFAGAIIGGSLHSAIGLRALLVPAVLLVSAIVVDQVSPLSLQEEQDEMQPGG